jgi:lipopolysaccharide biosynthesis regulator YciM
MVGFIAYQNPQAVDFTLVRGVSFHVSLTVLVLFAFCLGALIVLVVSIVRDTKRSFRLRKERKAQKREIERLSAYSVILERLMWGNVKDIENRLESISKDFKEEGRFLRVRAELYKRQGRWNEAYQIISQLRLVQESPKISTMMEEARLAKAAGLEEKALGTYKEILTINASYLPALQGMREILEELEKWEEIVPIQERIIKASSEKEPEKKRLAGYRYRLARELLNEAEEASRQKGVEIMRSLMKKDPKNVSLYVTLGNYYQQNGKTKEAIKIWEKGFAKTGDATLLALQEDLYIEEKKEGEILKRYAKAIKDSPDNVAAAFFYIRFCLRQDKLEEAGKVIEGMPEKVWEYPFMRLLKAVFLARDGKKEEAFDLCEDVAKDKDWMRLPYECQKCGEKYKAWVDICSRCGEIGSLTFDLT